MKAAPAAAAAVADAAPFVEVSRLTKTFATRRLKVRAVTDVSFAIARAQTFALVGESGSGKSTIARMLVGLSAPDSGRVVIDGVTMRRSGRGMAPLRRRIQMVFQDPYASLNPRHSAGAIVAEPIRAFRLARGAAVGPRVDALLSSVGLSPEDAEKFPHAFSGGQRQRVSIARALASAPEFLVCDEPTSSLDVSVQAQILDTLADLKDRLGLTMLFISHNLAVVRHVADRIGVLYLGRLVEAAPAGALFATPRHPYTRMLIDAVPRLTPGVVRASIPGEPGDPARPPPGCPFHPRCPLVNHRCRREVPQLKPAGATLVACHAVEEGRG